MSEFYMAFARKINKIAEFYMIIVLKYCSRILGGGRVPLLHSGLIRLLTFDMGNLLLLLLPPPPPAALLLYTCQISYESETLNKYFQNFLLTDGRTTSYVAYVQTDGFIRSTRPYLMTVTGRNFATFSQ